MSMSSSRPYVIRALYEWILDNSCTPYVLVNAEGPGVDVPREYVKDGQIVLNISPAAVVDLVIDNEQLGFNGRFGGVPVNVVIPMSSVVGIYARENGQGMVFDNDDHPLPEPPSTDPAPRGGGNGDKRPSLKVVK
jgi:stringent starvation protein B